MGPRPRTAEVRARTEAQDRGRSLDREVVSSEEEQEADPAVAEQQRLHQLQQQQLIAEHQRRLQAQLPQHQGRPIERGPAVMPQYSDASWRGAILTHQHMQWYKVETLMRMLRNVWKINFSIVEQRAQAMTQLNNLIDDAPFSKEQRFPERDAYISTAHGDWVRKIQQLRTSLSLKDHCKDKKSTGGSTVESSDFGDSMIAFHNAVTNLMMQLSQQENIFMRDSFESYYRLEWQN